MRRHDRGFMSDQISGDIHRRQRRPRDPERWLEDPRLYQMGTTVDLTFEDPLWDHVVGGDALVGTTCYGHDDRAGHGGEHHVEFEPRISWKAVLNRREREALVEVHAGHTVKWDEVRPLVHYGLIDINRYERRGHTFTEASLSADGLRVLAELGN